MHYYFVSAEEIPKILIVRLVAINVQQPLTIAAATIVKEDGCNGGLLVAANNHCLMSKFGKFGSHHC